MTEIRRRKPSSSRVRGMLRGIKEAIPAGVPQVLKRFWRFTRDNSKEFSKHLKDSKEKDKELTRAVVREFKK